MLQNTNLKRFDEMKIRIVKLILRIFINLS